MNQQNILEQFGRNLSKLVGEQKIDPVIGRDEEIRNAIRILSRKTKNNPVLIGEPGVGKTAIVEGLAQRIFSQDVPENLKDVEIYEIDLSSIIAGASMQGQFEQRLKAILNEVEKQKGKVILFIDEIHQLIGAGKTQGAMDAANILKPLMARGQVKIIGATTLNEYREYIERDSAFERRMQKIMVLEPTEVQTKTILRGLKGRWEAYHGVKITDDAIEQAVKLSTRYITDRYLPDKAIDVIDEACASIKVSLNSVPYKIDKLQREISNLKMEQIAIKKDNESSPKLKLIESKLKELETEYDKEFKVLEKEKATFNSKKVIKTKLTQLEEQSLRLQQDGLYEKSAAILYGEIPKLKKDLEDLNKVKFELLSEEVSVKEINSVIAKWTNIPIEELTQKQSEKILHIEDNLRKSVVGQDGALRKVADTIMRNKAGISNPDAPIGSFLFLGPTGVGKTEVARSLSKLLFSTSSSFKRIDMSEYMEKHAVSKLIGSPPGYIGYDQGGQLTEFVRRNPYSLILFDEIEKAHPDVLNILLQVMDDGHLTDAKGVKVNFKNTIIIMTSNIGSQELLQGKKDDAIKMMQSYLRPEFINRIDEVVTFNPIQKEMYLAIIKKEIINLNERLIDKNIRIDISDKGIKEIIDKSFNPEYGARPLKKYIQRHLETLIAKTMVQDNITRDATFNVDFKNKQFVANYKKTSL